MKKITIMTALTLVVLTAEARPVDPPTARRAAEQLLGRPVVDATPKHFTECYLMTAVDGNGFVLLPADDRIRPLLAYSHEASFPTEDMPTNLASWIDAYQRDMAALKAMNIAQTPEVAQEWDLMLNGTPKRRTPGVPVRPLVTSLWDQSPFYNDRCPYDSAASKHAVTGCTATATAQVMRYHNHPPRGRGQHSYHSSRYGELAVDYDTSVYDWENMPNRLTIVDPLVKRHAVAKLCYEVGVGMDMSYSANSSGAYTHSGGMLQRHSAELALENHFLYNPGMYNACKEGMSDAEWEDLISDEINAGHPLIYTGSSSSGGHAFVVDGYDTTGLFHVNWGWGGQGNGYFTLSHLALGTPGQSDYMPYNEMNEALIGVYPITPNATSSEVTVISADPTRGSVSGSGTYPVAGGRVLLRAFAADGYRFSHWASGNRANPIFYFPTVDYTDTAYFVPLSEDTLGYCQSFIPNFDTVFTMSHCEWGIRIPASRIASGKSLRQVQNFIYTTGDYALRIFQGEHPATPLYEDVLHLESYGWRTIDLSSPLPLDPSQPLWIAFATDNVNYAAGISPHTGVDDGSWILHEGEWQLVDTTATGYYTWSIRGILSESNAVIEVESRPLQWRLNGRTLQVDNPQGLEVGLYDLMGRRLAVSTSVHMPSFSIPSAGIYLLKAEGLPAQRVVVYSSL